MQHWPFPIDWENRSGFSSTPSFTQDCLQSRVSSTCLFLVDCWNDEIIDVQPRLSLASHITVLPLHEAFLICCDLQTLLAHMSWLSHLWLSAGHRQTRIDGTGPTPVILSADGLQPPTSLSLSAAFWKKWKKIGNWPFNRLFWKFNFSSFYSVYFNYLSFHSPIINRSFVSLLMYGFSEMVQRQEARDNNMLFLFCRITCVYISNLGFFWSITHLLVV